MSYESISVREAMERINTKWFLPHVQRPFVWGERYQREKYIYKLFDSLIEGYPIGTIILWETKDKVPFRKFKDDYCPDDLPSGTIVEEGRFGDEGKCLIYDGQQRLQVLYSCLMHRFDGQVLCYNVLHDRWKDNQEEDEETGFRFFPSRQQDIPPNYIRLTEIFSQQPHREVDYRKEVLKRLGDIASAGQELIVEKNINILWKVFVDTDKKVLAYFMVREKDKRRVEEVFYRLNTTGIPLQQSDILFSMIKADFTYFEENLWEVTKNIKQITQGFTFTAYQLLQFLNLLKYGTEKIDPDRVKKEEIKEFENLRVEVEQPLYSFFSDLLFGQFKINHESIIPRKLALLPIMAYFYFTFKNEGITYNKFTPKCQRDLAEYLIRAQVNDWNISTIIRPVYKIISENPGDFPLDLIRDYIIKDGRRPYEVKEQLFCYIPLFAIKILTPDKPIVFTTDVKGRLNPELDHIFPRNPNEKQSEQYYKAVNTLWNLQIVKGNINSQKGNLLPAEFFKQTPNFLSEYDFLPTTDLEDSIWNPENIETFLDERKKRMVGFLQQKYGIEMQP